MAGKIKRNTEGLKKNAQKKRQQSFQKFESAIDQLIREKGPVNFNIVARISGLSKAWLYREPEVRARIEILRQETSNKRPKLVSESINLTSYDKLREINQGLKQKNKELRAENQDLKQQNEVAYGFMIKCREQDKEIQGLRAQKANLIQVNEETDLFFDVIEEYISESKDLLLIISKKINELDQRVSGLESEVYLSEDTLESLKKIIKTLES